MNMSKITLEDCIEMYQMKGMCAVISDGQVVEFVGEEESVSDKSYNH